MGEDNRRLRLPVQGRERVAAVVGIRRALADDADAQLDRMVAAGWDLDGALDALEVWRACWHGYIDQAFDEVAAVRRWAA